MTVFCELFWSKTIVQCCCITDAYEAEQLLKEVDIHSVTGVLKLYLRELPEALFTDALYPELLRAWSATQVCTVAGSEI